VRRDRNAQDIDAVLAVLRAARRRFVAGGLMADKADSAWDLLAGKEAP